MVFLHYFCTTIQVLPISVYERENNALYNTVAMVDADGTMMGIYRKSHIPDGPGMTTLDW